MAIDKSGWNKNIKVSQKTINEIKSLGMKRSLELITMYGRQGQGMGKEGKDMRDAGRELMATEFTEGIRRLYGPNRVAKAGITFTPSKRLGSGAPAKKKIAPGKISTPYSNTQAKKIKTGDAAKAAGARSVAKSK